MKTFLSIISFLFAFYTLSAQHYIDGIIYESSKNEDPLLGVNVYWLNTSVGTTTNEDGAFRLPYKNKYQQLVVSYVGFKTDTLTIHQPTQIKHWMVADNSLDEIVLQNRKQTAFKSLLQAQNVTTITSDELLKAACCNLSESFETNPSIDVNFPDALTGTRQIKMLGLKSLYTLIAVENIPSFRGASQNYGLSFVPGTWVESIQVSKGAGSVVNGFESIAGQINAELQKPASDAPFFLNLYAGQDGRYELNNHLNFKLNQKWHTGLYLHGNLRNTKNDMNDDGFLDAPLQEQINVMNRWHYQDTQKGIVGFLNINYLSDQKQIGQLQFNPNTDQFTTNAWGGEIQTQRASAALKLGYVFPDKPYQSLGFQAAYSDHQQESYFGFNVYDIYHKSFYSNFILSSIIGDSRHNFKTGVSVAVDDFEELVKETGYERNENSVGGFFEYSYDNLGNLNLVTGVRVDYHNQMGVFITPRVHARYTPWEKAALKASFGRGVRAASIFAENQQFLASQREIAIANTEGNFYGLDQEIAWNYGISLLQGFRLFNRDADVTVDFYRTHFENQVVVDWENPQLIRFYNLQGSSFSNSFQTELNFSPSRATSIRLSYRLFDVQTDYLEGKQVKPLTPKHRFFANVGYETELTPRGSQWKFDATYNWLSEQRFPSTASNPAPFRVSETTPQLNTLNAQVTKVFSPAFEIYLGAENLTNVRQENPILSANNPFGTYFDTTFVYGPIFGSMFYTGLRWKM